MGGGMSGMGGGYGGGYTDIMQSQLAIPMDN